MKIFSCSKLFNKALAAGVNSGLHGYLGRDVAANFESPASHQPKNAIRRRGRHVTARNAAFMNGDVVWDS